MKKLLVTCALVLSSAAAFAADLPVRSSAPAAAFAGAPAYNWSGLYVGAHIGGGWFENQNVALSDAPSATFPAGFVFAPQEGDGVIGGGQVGFSWQMDRFVVGLEGDISATDLRGTSSSHSVRLPGRYSEQTLETDWVATATARAGFAVDNLLLYVKGGWAWADVNAHHSTFTQNGNLIATSIGGETRDGWTIGAGVEWGFLANWSVKLEYNYIDFGKETVTRTSTDTAAFGGAVLDNLRESDFDMHLVKAGVNYRF